MELARVLSESPSGKRSPMTRSIGRRRNQKQKIPLINGIGEAEDQLKSYRLINNIKNGITSREKGLNLKGYLPENHSK